jgi:hypothetical protein
VTLRARVRSIDPQLSLTKVHSMDEALSRTEAPRRFNAVLSSSFAAAAVLLALMGIYSVIAFSAAMRTREIAISMALGSQRADIVRLVLISGVTLARLGSAFPTPLTHIRNFPLHLARLRSGAAQAVSRHQCERRFDTVAAGAQ